MRQGLRRSETMPALALLALSAATLAVVYASQYIGGLQPCQLCLYQRWPWWGALALSALALIPALSPPWRALLLSYAPDWRWLLERDDSPWYPTARLFRQPAPGDWAAVAETVADQLRAFLRRAA